MLSEMPGGLLENLFLVAPRQIVAQMLSQDSCRHGHLSDVTLALSDPPSQLVIILRECPVLEKACRALSLGVADVSRSKLLLKLQVWSSEEPSFWPSHIRHIREWFGGI